MPPGTLPTTGSSRDTQGALLRVVYDRRIHRLFSYKSILLQLFGRIQKQMAMGDHFSIALHTSMGGGGQWSSAGMLPQATHQKYKRAQFSPTQWNGRIEVDATFMKDAMGQAAEGSPLDLETRGLAAAHRREWNYDLYRDGSGILATPTGATSGTQLSVSVAEANSLRAGQRVDILLKSTGQPGPGGVANVEIVVNRSTGLVTLVDGTLGDGTGATINGAPTTYGVYRQGSYNDAILGLIAAVNAGNPPVGNYGGIDRTNDANDAWRGVNVDHSAAAPTLQSVRELLDRIDNGSPAEDVTHILCPQAIFNRFVADHEGRRRFGGRDMTLNGWARAFEFEGRPLIKDVHCPEGYIFAISAPTFAIVQNSEGEWMDEDGGILHRVDGRTAYEAAYFRRGQLVCNSPPSNGFIHNINAAAA